MNTLYLFFPDFSEKDVYVNVLPCSFDVYVDYESLSVALYHIIQNSVKYCMPKQEIEISFQLNDNFVEVDFKMASLRIEEDETDNIFKASISGKNAKKHNLSGSGMGMSLVRRIIDLNSGKIEVVPLRTGQVTLNNIPYENNIIRMYLPKK